MYLTDDEAEAMMDEMTKDLIAKGIIKDDTSSNRYFTEKLSSARNSYELENIILNDLDPCPYKFRLIKAVSPTLEYLGIIVQMKSEVDSKVIRVPAGSVFDIPIVGNMIKTWTIINKQIKEQ